MDNNLLLNEDIERLEELAKLKEIDVKKNVSKNAIALLYLSFLGGISIFGCMMFCNLSSGIAFWMGLCGAVMIGVPIFASICLLDNSSSNGKSSS